MRHIMKYKLIIVISLALCTFFTAFSSNIFAKGGSASDQDATIKVKKNKNEQTEKIRKEIIDEATNAINETKKALSALDKGKNKKALSYLEKATGKLELILAREPKLALAPTGVKAVTYNTLGSVEDIKRIRDEAEDLLEDGKVQKARHLLRGLASETVISTTNIPLATYPAAIKEAVRLIDAKKRDDAKLILQRALNTLVVTDRIIPIPIVQARAHLEKAEKLAEKKERKDEENKELSKLLKSAQENINLAEALGYGTEKELESFSDEIKKISKKTSKGKSGFGFFDKIKSTMTSMVKGSQKEQAETPKS